MHAFVAALNTTIQSTDLVIPPNTTDSLKPRQTSTNKHNDRHEMQKPAHKDQRRQDARTSSFTHSPHGPSEGTFSGRWHRRTWFARSAHPRCPLMREPPPSRENNAVRMLGTRRKSADVAGQRLQVLSIQVRRDSSHAGNVCTNGKTCGGPVTCIHVLGPCVSRDEIRGLVVGARGWMREKAMTGFRYNLETQ